VTLRVVPVRPAQWDDVCALFEAKGPRGGSRNAPAFGCWCMYWRDRGLPHGEPKKQALQALVRAGREPGLLAYDGGEPVGWVSIAPREEFPHLLRSPRYRPRPEDGGGQVWSIVCFVVDKPRRGEGVAAALLAAAVEHAFARGASAVEAYPHVLDSRDYMGNVALFESAGFATVRDASKRRIVRLERPAA
jgi:GNAT superfamily N-acetyltransferase